MLDYTPKDFRKPNRFDYGAWVVVFAWPLLSALLLWAGVIK